MLGWFPSPYPDELFYSICARYDDAMQYPNRNGANLDLFDRENSRVIVDFPCELRRITKVLPENQLYTVNRIIEKYSLLNFYSPFLPSERVKRIRSEMENERGRAVHKIVGLLGSTIQTPRWLRYCRSCVICDRRTYHEAYWHRIHQLPGIVACAAHQVLLEHSCVSTRGDGYGIFSCAEQDVQLHEAHEVSTGNLSIHINLARDSSWLLAQSSLVLDLDKLRDGFISLLREKGFTMRDGSIKTNKLKDAVKEAYPTAFLLTLQCGIHKQVDFGWVKRFTDNLLALKASHPLRWLLLLHFLGLNARLFFDQYMKPKTSCRLLINELFGHGPYPCLNPVCKYLNQRVIADVAISYNWKINNLPIGTFTCECGFSYARKGSGKSPSDLYYRDYIRSHGKIWEASLKKLWNDRSLSTSNICVKLGISFRTIIYHAVRLGLEFPRIGPNGALTTAKPAFIESTLNSPRLQVTKPLLTKRNREKWLSALKQYPTASRMQLELTILPRVYRWLYDHDREWLKTKMPPVRKRNYSSRRKDWAIRDILLTGEVQRIASRIKTAKGFPIQVTKVSIARQLQQPSLLDRAKCLPKLPKAAAALNAILESSLDFAIRRIRYVTECFRSEGIAPSCSILMRRARIDIKRYHNSPELKVAVDFALESLSRAAKLELGNISSAA